MKRKQGVAAAQAQSSGARPQRRPPPSTESLWHNAAVGRPAVRGAEGEVMSRGHDGSVARMQADAGSFGGAGGVPQPPAARPYLAREDDDAAGFPAAFRARSDAAAAGQQWEDPMRIDRKSVV